MSRKLSYKNYIVYPADAFKTFLYLLLFEAAFLLLLGVLIYQNQTVLHLAKIEEIKEGILTSSRVNNFIDDQSDYLAQFPDQIKYLDDSIPHVYVSKSYFDKLTFLGSKLGFTLSELTVSDPGTDKAGTLLAEYRGQIGKAGELVYYLEHQAPLLKVKTAKIDFKKSTVVVSSEILYVPMQKILDLETLLGDTIDSQYLQKEIIPAQ